MPAAAWFPSWGPPFLAERAAWSGRSPRNRCRSGAGFSRRWPRRPDRWCPAYSLGSAAPSPRKSPGTGHGAECAGQISRQNAWHDLLIIGRRFQRGRRGLRRQEKFGTIGECLDQGLEAIAVLDEGIVSRLEGGGLDLFGIGAHTIGIKLARQTGREAWIVAQGLAQAGSAVERLSCQHAGNVNLLAVLGAAMHAQAIELLQGQTDRIGMIMAGSAGRIGRMGVQPLAH